MRRCLGWARDIEERLEKMREKSEVRRGRKGGGGEKFGYREKKPPDWYLNPFQLVHWLPEYDHHHDLGILDPPTLYMREPRQLFP
ncbi:hypothetical protein Pmani_025219 [Petrolisthes manimaculis]|uniref:Uncharacterized protein n=1 Tax=Petrolisthes manimaculis TaxID=1843537 RepID=A0AAE1P7P1_9EUCA|nr:hypothetical protein Pmani_025219 [Petrolisthes manimaculis]